MDTKYGLRGSLTPSYPFENLVEDLDIDGFKIHVENGIFEIGFDDEKDKVRARDVARQMILAWSLDHDIKISVDLNHKWSIKADGNTDHFLSLSEKVKPIAFVRTNTISLSARVCIVKPDLYDSSSFKNSLSLLKKSLTNESLQKSLAYFYEEILDDEMPLYGVYKAVEELCLAVGGEKELAALAKQPIRYVSDLKQTTQIERHARTSARRLLTDGECRQRAKTLIQVYANSI